MEMSNKDISDKNISGGCTTAKVKEGCEQLDQNLCTTGIQIGYLTVEFGGVYIGMQLQYSRYFKDIGNSTLHYAVCTCQEAVA